MYSRFRFIEPPCDQSKVGLITDLLYSPNLFTEVFGSTGFGNNGFSGITDIFAIPKLKFCIKRAQSNGFSGVTDKMAIPN